MRDEEDGEGVPVDAIADAEVDGADCDGGEEDEVASVAAVTSADAAIDEDDDDDVAAASSISRMREE